MKNYIIVDGDKIQKTIEKLETGIKTLSLTDGFKDIGKIDALKQILSQSTPLISEIEKSWEHGYTRGYNLAYCEGVNSECLTPDKQNYISNLKLDI